jgi:hypothetical protein
LFLLQIYARTSSENDYEYRRTQLERLVLTTLDSLPSLGIYLSYIHKERETTMDKIDTSGFTTAEEFDTAYRGIKYPKRPVTPERVIDKKTFDSDAEYYRTLADASEQYEKDMSEYKRQVKEAGEVGGQVASDFREFCISDHLDADIPEDIKGLVYSAAYEDGHSAGFSEVYNCMDDFAEIANKAYKAGVKSKK